MKAIISTVALAAFGIAGKIDLLLEPAALAANIAKLERECNGSNLKACDELQKIATNPKERPPDRIAAIRSLHDQRALAEIARTTDGELRTAASDRLNEILSPDFLRAIAAGDVNQMNALVAKGVSVDPHGSALEIEDVQASSGGFRYKVSYADRAASQPMLTAIRSGRVDAVRALVSLGADVKTELILEGASLGIENASPVPIQVIENTVRLGFSTNLNWQNAFFHLNAGVVVSSFRPTPARKGTYLTVAKQLLATARDEKSREGLQQIVDFLQQSGVLDPAKGCAPGAASARPTSSAGVYAVGAGVSPPTLLSKVEPTYSDTAYAANCEGSVQVYVEVGTDGLAHNIQIVRGLGLGLDEKAIEAIKVWKFKPGMKDGQPVPVMATIEVSFHLVPPMETRKER
jgi:TonB family protein